MSKPAKRTHPITIQQVARLSVEDLLLIHDHVVQEFAETRDPVSPPGVRDIALLESAVGRQDVGFENDLKYSSAVSNAATLMFGVCNDHPFHNGNKRTALLAGLLHLDRNGLVLENAGQDSLYDLMTRIACHDVKSLLFKSQQPFLDEGSDGEVRAIELWLKARSRRIKMGERPITYSQLYRILQNFGFELGTKQDNHIGIYRRRKKLFGGYKLTHVGRCPCPGDARIVDIGHVKTIRKQLELTEDDGYDSVAFYDTQTVVDVFIQKHRQTLRRLAKT